MTMSTLVWGAVVGGAVGGLFGTTAKFINQDETTQIKAKSQLAGAAVGCMTGGISGGMIGATIGGPIGGTVGAVIGIVGSGSAGAVLGSILGYNTAGVISDETFK